MDPNLEQQKVLLELEEKELQTKEFVEGFPKFQRWLLIVLVVLIIPGFFGAKYLTAALYYNNFQKTQAIVAHPATLFTLPVSIQSSQILPVTANHYSAYAIVKNNNKSLVAPDLKYTFNFYDSGGNMIGSFNGNDFLLAGQIKYLIAPNVTLTTQPVQLKVLIPDPTWQNRLVVPTITLTNSLPTSADQQNPPGFAVNGTFRNDSNYTLATVLVKGVVHDNSNSIIAVTSHLENAVSPGQSRAYNLFWPRFLQNSAGRIEVSVETNPLDPGNLQ